MLILCLDDFLLPGFFVAFGASHIAGAAEMRSEVDARIFWDIAMMTVLAFVFAGFGFDFDTKAPAKYKHE